MHLFVLEGFDIGRKEAEEMIMSARVLAGWIKAEDLQPAVEESADEPAEGGKDAAVES